MRVVHNVPTWLHPTEAWLATQVRALPPGVESHVRCNDVSNLERFPWPRLHRRPDPLWTWNDPDRALKADRRRWAAHLLRTVRRVGGDIVHSHFGPSGANVAERLQKARVPHVVSFYGYDATYLPRTMPSWSRKYQDMFPRVGLVVCEGSHMGATVEALGCPKDRVAVHRLGVDLQQLRYRRRERAAGAPLRILVAAGFREKKGIPDAVEAVGRLPRDVPARLTLVGDSNGQARAEEEKGRILAAISRWSLEGRVDRTGFLPHSKLIELAYQHDVFLAPSVTASDGDAEGGAPVGLIEMMATGLPVVSTRHCDIPNIVEDGRTGLLAAERDPSTLADHLATLARDPGLAASLAEQARAFVEREHDAARQGDRLAALYERTIEEAGRPAHGRGGSHG